MNQAFSIFFVMMMAVPSFACLVTQEDGTVIDDPSLTSCTTSSTVTPSTVSEMSADSLVGTTQRMKAIDELCGESAKNYLYNGYTSSSACYDAQNSALNTDRTKVNAEAAAKAKADADAAKEAGANKPQQSPQSPPASQPQQAQNGDKAKEDAAKKDEAGKGDTAKAADAGDKGKESAPGKGGSQCKKAVMEAMQKCRQEKAVAEMACDPSKDKGLEAAGDRLNTDAVLAATQGARTTQNAQRVALSRQQTGEAAVKFGGTCQEAAASCGNVCEAVEEKFKQSCSSAPAGEKAEAQKVVDRSQDKEQKEFKLYCKIDLAEKGGKAIEEGKSQASAAGQHADVGQTASGAGAGMGGAASALAGLMQNKKEQDKETEAASKELEYQKQLTEAAEGTAATCSKSQFRCLPSCVSYNASVGIVSTVGSCATQSAVLSHPTPSPVSTTETERAPATLDQDAP